MTSTILRFPLVVLLTMAITGCRQTAISPTETPRIDYAAASPIVQQIERQQYAILKREYGPPTAWEVDTLRMETKRTTWFRTRVVMMDGREDYNCRFRLIEESYHTDGEARTRLTRIGQMEPGATAEEQLGAAKRDGFRVGAVVNIFAPEAELFEGDVYLLVARIAASTEGAEVAQGANAAPPN